MNARSGSARSRTEPADQPQELSTTPGRTWSRTSVVIGALVLVVLTGALSALAAQFNVVPLMIGGLVAISVGLVAIRSFEAFIATVILIRPVLDVFAGGADGGGVSLTELFGVGVTFVLVIWLTTIGRPLRAYVRDFGPLHVSLFALVAAAAISTLGSAHLMPSVTFLARMITAAVLFYSIDLALRRGLLRERVLAMAVAGSAVVPLLYPMLAPLGIRTTHVKDGVVALKSVFHLSNNFAYFIVPFLLAAIAFAVRTKGWARAFCLFVISVCAYELVKTETRGAWLAAAAGVVVLGLVLERRLIALGITVVALGFVFSDGFRSRIINLIPDPSAPRTVDSFSWRLDQWGKLLPLMKDAPITGVGPEGALAATAKEPHNEYVRFFVETGVVGGIMFLGFVASLVYVAFRVWQAGRATDDRVHTAAKAAFLAYAIACAVAFFGENLIDSISFMSILMPITALALNADRWEVSDHQVRYRRRSKRQATQRVATSQT